MDLEKKIPPSPERLRSTPDRSRRTRREIQQRRIANSTRRALLRRFGICINGSLPLVLLAARRSSKPRVEHGPPVKGKGGRCQRCADIHAKSRDGGTKRPVEIVPSSAPGLVTPVIASFVVKAA